MTRLFCGYSHVAGFLEKVRHSHDTPSHKYTEPQTEAQEIGWHTEPLVVAILYHYSHNYI